MRNPLLSAPALAFAVAGPASAAFVDDFDNTSNLHNRSATDVAIAAAAGRVSLTRNTAGFSLVDFYPDAEATGAVGFSNASNTFDLATEGTLEIGGAQRIGDGFFSLTAFFYDAADSFIGERSVVFDTAAEGDLSFDVNAAAAGLGTASAYNIGLAIIGNPGEGAAVDGFRFDSFSAVPEPASAALLGLGGLLLTRRRPR